MTQGRILLAMVLIPLLWFFFMVMVGLVCYKRCGLCSTHKTDDCTCEFRCNATVCKVISGTRGIRR